jgi:gamma-glutamyltranspeptidase/glutathione hydrolase
VTINNFMHWTDMNPANPVAAQPGDLASNGDISCMSPLMIFDGNSSSSIDELGSLRWLLGTPGSFGIPQTQTQLVMNVIDHGFDMQAAIEQPRVRLPETGPGQPPVRCNLPSRCIDLL